MSAAWEIIQGLEPWAIILLLASLAKAKWAERASEESSERWRKIALAAIEGANKSREIADKNYQAAVSWKNAFEKKSPPKGARPVLGHCHDPRCEARELKVHACHDLTCKQHIHEKRAR